MVNFGKKLMADQVDEWKGYYINYKLMKKMLKQYVEQTQLGDKDHKQVLKDFSRILDDQGIVAVVGALSRNLEYLQHHQGSFISIYDHPSVILKDPIIDQVNHAVQKLTHATSFMQFLGQHALISQEDAQSGSEDPVDDQSYHFMSLLLNLVNTFLYMVNTYIIVPTADDYSVSLGAAATVCGIIIGSMAVAQVFSSVYFSAWSNKSYFRPLVFSSIMLFFGNLLYALAYDLNSLTVLLIGRLLCGYAIFSVYASVMKLPICRLGSARAVNRRYISDCVPVKIRLQASAGFVSASALGMACGPALAGFLQTKFKIYSLTFNQSTLPGWIMSIAWLVYLLWLWLTFREPEHLTKSAIKPQPSESGMLSTEKRMGIASSIVLIKVIFCMKTGHQGIASLEDGLSQPLILGRDQIQEENTEDNDDNDSERSHEPARSIASAYRLLTPSVKVSYVPLIMLSFSSVALELGRAEPKILDRVQLLIYFMLKYAMEILLSESSVVTTYYFGWSTSAVAIFLAILGLTVLPVNAIVGSYITNWFEDRQILLASEVMVLLGARRYALYFCACATISKALSTMRPETAVTNNYLGFFDVAGVNLSLLSRVMSSRLSRGTYNGGLLSTEAGTLARVIADATITAAGYLGTDLLINVTLLPPLVISIVSIVATFYTYNTLY
ncbi:hypothetical protein PR202_ga19314 [Eleusine coracana subsp. coracana]|uniref:SPX domain-containing protein n=1 Tax=Eleusine coracana subsp. coracana TaxID=191504 RepID=A0AAV5CUC7_ELECO|nr:hypothetical protein PR202_ga19314 [Eleusine coracana subsp. coracana]